MTTARMRCTRASRRMARSAGNKGNLYEGGHRVPFIARWPARIPAGGESAALFAHVDMIATFASLTGQKIPAGSGA